MLAGGEPWNFSKDSDLGKRRTCGIFKSNRNYQSGLELNKSSGGLKSQRSSAHLWQRSFSFFFFSDLHFHSLSPLPMEMNWVSAHWASPGLAVTAQHPAYWKSGPVGAYRKRPLGRTHSGTALATGGAKTWNHPCTLRNWKSFRGDTPKDKTFQYNEISR